MTTPLAPPNAAPDPAQPRVDSLSPEPYPVELEPAPDARPAPPASLSPPRHDPRADVVDLTNERVDDDPITDEPMMDAPVEDAPVEDAPVEDAPVEDAPMPDAPMPDRAVTDSPPADVELAGSPPANPEVVHMPQPGMPVLVDAEAELPVTEEPVSDEPEIARPVATEPVTEVPLHPSAAAAPEADERDAEEHATSGSAADEPASGKSAPEDSAEEEPVAEALMVPNSTADAPVSVGTVPDTGKTTAEGQSEVLPDAKPQESASHAPEREGPRFTPDPVSRHAGDAERLHSDSRDALEHVDPQRETDEDLPAHHSQIEPRDAPQDKAPLPNAEVRIAAEHERLLPEDTAKSQEQTLEKEDEAPVHRSLPSSYPPNPPPPTPQHPAQQTESRAHQDARLRSLILQVLSETAARQSATPADPVAGAPQVSAPAPVPAPSSVPVPTQDREMSTATTDSQQTVEQSLAPLSNGHGRVTAPGTTSPPTLDDVAPFTPAWYSSLTPDQMRSVFSAPNGEPTFFHIRDPLHNSLFAAHTPSGASSEANVLYQTTAYLHRALNELAPIAGRTEDAQVTSVWRCLRGVAEMLNTRYDLLCAVRQRDEIQAQLLEAYITPPVGEGVAARRVKGELVRQARKRIRSETSEDYDSGERVKRARVAEVQARAARREARAVAKSRDPVGSGEADTQIDQPTKSETTSRKRPGFQLASTKKDPGSAKDSDQVLAEKSDDPASRTPSRRQQPGTPKASGVATRTRTPKGSNAAARPRTSRDTGATARPRTARDAAATTRSRTPEDTGAVSRRSIRSAARTSENEPVTATFSHVMRSYSKMASRPTFSRAHSFAGYKWRLQIHPRGHKDRGHLAVYLVCDGPEKDLTPGRITRRSSSAKVSPVAKQSWRVKVFFSIRVLHGSSLLAKAAVASKDGTGFVIDSRVLDPKHGGIESRGSQRGVGSEFIGVLAKEYSREADTGGFVRLAPIARLKVGGYADEASNVTLLAFMRLEGSS